MSSRAFQKCKKSKMHVKLLRLKTHFVKIVTVSKILEVPKFQKKSFRWVLLKNAILPKTHAKKSFLPPPCEERNPNMLVEDLMLIESDSEFCAISASVTLCIDSAQQLDKGKRDPRTKNRKRQHLHCVSLETAALALRLVGFSVLHRKAKRPASKESRNCGASICARDNTSQRS
jgi:hypothetical protein